MSLVQRKPRPLTRDESSLRDDRLFILACDDTYAPKQYFGFFKIARIQVHVFETPADDNKSHAKYVLQRLEEIEHEEDDERWMLLDTDHYTKGPHLREFIGTIKEARQKGIKVALSKPCFELWLLLHHVDETAIHSLTDAKSTEKMLREKLGEYNKVFLKAEHYPLSSVCTAYRAAERLDNTIKGEIIPRYNTSRVYLIWKAIVAKALPLQLPPELIELLPKNQ